MAAAPVSAPAMRGDDDRLRRDPGVVVEAMKQLRGRNAVITGAAAGLGRAMARRFADEGMQVLVADVNEAGARAVASEIAATGATAIAAKVDVGEPASLLALAELAAAALGGCDLLVANVGVQRIGKTDALTRDDWQWLIGVNLLGTVETVRAFLPLLRKSADAHVLFTGSVSSVLSVPRLAAYTASKMAVLGYAETLRVELQDEGIGVTALLPAGMMTTHLDSSAAARPAGLGRSPDLDPDDAVAVVNVLAATPDAMLTPEDAIRDLVPALLENRPYVVTHAPNRDAVAERFTAILAAFDRAAGLAR
jgi:NAD(P)-dependent dehydrogenase (short-subunit alcohol dehydrogenase family)